MTSGPMPSPESTAMRWVRVICNVLRIRVCEGSVGGESPSDGVSGRWSSGSEKRPDRGELEGLSLAGGLHAQVTHDGVHGVDVGERRGFENVGRKAHAVEDAVVVFNRDVDAPERVAAFAVRFDLVGEKLRLDAREAHDRVEDRVDRAVPGCGGRRRDGRSRPE